MTIKKIKQNSFLRCVEERNELRALKNLKHLVEKTKLSKAEEGLHVGAYLHEKHLYIEGEKYPDFNQLMRLIVNQKQIVLAGISTNSKDVHAKEVYSANLLKLKKLLNIAATFGQNNRTDWILNHNKIVEYYNFWEEKSGNQALVKAGCGGCWAGIFSSGRVDEQRIPLVDAGRLSW
jgi:hypothetical protein